MEHPCLGLLHSLWTTLPYKRFLLAAHAPQTWIWLFFEILVQHPSRNATWLLAWSSLAWAFFTSSSPDHASLQALPAGGTCSAGIDLDLRQGGVTGGNYALAARALSAGRASLGPYFSNKTRRHLHPLLRATSSTASGSVGASASSPGCPPCLTTVLRR